MVRELSFLSQNLLSKKKRGFYLFYYNVIFKDCVLFKYNKSSVGIDVIVVKKHVSFKFCRKVCKIKARKKKGNVIITIIIEYT